MIREDSELVLIIPRKEQAVFDQKAFETFKIIGKGRSLLESWNFLK